MSDVASEEVLVAKTGPPGRGPAPARGAHAVGDAGRARDRDAVLVRLHRRVVRGAHGAVRVRHRPPDRPDARDQPEHARAPVPVGGRVLHVHQPRDPPPGGDVRRLALLPDQPARPRGDPRLHGDGARQRAPGQVRLQLPVVALRHPRHRRDHVRRLPRHLAVGQAPDHPRQPRDPDRGGTQRLGRVRPRARRLQLRAAQPGEPRGRGRKRHLPRRGVRHLLDHRLGGRVPDRGGEREPARHRSRRRWCSR